MFKFCSRCKKNKSSDSFRMRHEKRKGDFYYLNNTCRQCDADIAKENYKKAKDIEEFKMLNRERANKYRIENIDVVKEKDQARRQQERHKENRRNYIQKNKKKIFAQEKVCKEKWHKKNRDELTDVYVGSRLVQGTPLCRNELPPALIKLKRLQIICKRSLKIKTK